MWFGEPHSLPEDIPPDWARRDKQGTKDDHVQVPGLPFGDGSEPSRTGTCFSPSTSVFPYQYLSTNVPYSFIHLLPILYHLNN